MALDVAQASTRVTQLHPPPSVEPFENNHIEEIEEDQAIVMAPYLGGQKHPHELDNSNSDKEVAPSFFFFFSTTLALTTLTHDNISGWIDVHKKNGIQSITYFLLLVIIICPSVNIMTSLSRFISSL